MQKGAYSAADRPASRTMDLPAGEADIVLVHDHKAPKAPSPVRKRVHFGFVALHFYHSYRVW